MSLRRRVRAVVYLGPPKPQVTDEQAASMQLYRTEDRRVHAVPTRRPVKRKAA